MARTRDAATELSFEEKQEFKADGFVVVPQAVPRAVAERARGLITRSLPKNERRLLAPPELATHEHVLALFQDSCLPELMRRTMGPFPDVISCQIAVTPGGDLLGGRPGTHIDGSWSGPIPKDAAEIEPVRGRPLDAATYFGEDDELRGTNDGQLWQNPERTISLGSYTALVGICLNDQTKPGGGQLGVMRGMHEVAEEAFRRQRDAGGVIGPEGPGWPRIVATEDGGTMFNGIPDLVRERGMRAAEGIAPTEQWPWPELTPVLMEPGDAVVALHSLPHTPTPNMSSDARMNVYFRLRRWREDNPHENTRRLGHGVSDHLDRGYYGQWLEYPDSYDPWKTSVDFMCDHWSEWDGMQNV